MRENLLTVKWLVVLVAALPCVGRAESVTLEAESGALGSVWAISNTVSPEFRVCSRALSASEIAATYALGPDQLLSQASPELSMAAGASGVTLSWPLASAGLNLQWRTNLMLGYWQTVASPAPQIAGGRWQSTLPVTTNNAMFYRLSK